MKHEFREKQKRLRERDLVKRSLQLRNKSPIDSLHTMFDLCNFVEKINKTAEGLNEED